MRIPKGKIVHKELSSSFVDFGKFLEDLKRNSFSGLVELVGIKGEIEILMDYGDVSTVRITADGKRVGRDLIVEALRIAAADSMLISSYCLPPESVALLSSFLQGEILYENLPSEFTDPEKLVTKYEQEKGEYCIETLFTKNIGTGFIFLHDGHVVESVVSILDKDLTTGQEAVRQIVDGARELGATFNVYRSNLDAGATPSVGPVLPPAEVHAVFTALLAEFEKLAQASTRGLSFDGFLREACLACADQHPFLDPFAAEFSYRNGTFELNTVEPFHRVADGICFLIGSMADRLKNQKSTFSRDDYVQAVKAALADHEYVATELMIYKHLNQITGK